MRSYRLYCLDGAGKFTAAEWIGAADDSEAIAAAKAMQKDSRCELWEQGRKVADIPQHRP